MAPRDAYLHDRTKGAPTLAALAAPAATLLEDLGQLARRADSLVTYAEAQQAEGASLAEFGQLSEVVQLSNRLSRELWAAYEAIRTAREVLLHLAEAEGRLAPAEAVTGA